jgi:hypothetical protein
MFKTISNILSVANNTIDKSATVIDVTGNGVVELASLFESACKNIRIVGDEEMQDAMQERRKERAPRPAKAKATAKATPKPKAPAKTGKAAKKRAN